MFLVLVRFLRLRAVSQTEIFARVLVPNSLSKNTRAPPREKQKRWSQPLLFTRGCAFEFDGSIFRVTTLLALIADLVLLAAETDAERLGARLPLSSGLPERDWRHPFPLFGEMWAARTFRRGREVSSLRRRRCQEAPDVSERSLIIHESGANGAGVCVRACVRARILPPRAIDAIEASDHPRRLEAGAVDAPVPQVLEAV